MTNAQDLSVQLLLDSTWTSVDAYVNRGCKVTRGLDPNGVWPRPTQVDITLANPKLSLDPSNPESVLYGVAGRGTRVRVRLGDSNRTQAEATSWKPARSLAHYANPAKGRAEVGLVAEGILGRISRWTEVLRSPMYRTASTRANVLGHWALEDGSDATQLSNSTGGGLPGTKSGEVTLGDSVAPLGAASSAKLGAAGVMTGTVKSASTTAGWQVVLSCYLPAAQTATSRNIISWRCSNGYAWRWLVNNTNYSLQVDDASGTTVVNVTTSHDGKPPNGWLTFVLAASESAGTVSYGISWYQQNSTAVSFLSGNFAGAVGALRDWRVEENPATTGGWYSHIFGLTTTSDNLANDAARAVFNGYIGETAFARYARLTLEQGITRFAFGTGSDSQPMGPQRSDTLINLLREVVETDDCVIYDEPSAIALTLRPRRHLLDQTPVLALTFGRNVEDYVKLIDTQGIKNIVTVQNRDGGDFTASLTSGQMSTQQSPDGIGEEREAIDVNVADEGTQLEPLARWHLAKGTLPEPRYESITVNLVANPELEAACEAAKPGDLLTVAEIEPYLVNLLIVGIIETVGATSRRFEFQTEPYPAFAAGRYSDARFRYDVRSILAVAVDKSQTSWQVSAASVGDTWSQTAVPYDVVCAGERVTVTGCSAPAGLNQTLTVVRSANGIRKNQVVGSEVHISTPGRWAL